MQVSQSQAACLSESVVSSVRVLSKCVCVQCVRVCVSHFVHPSIQQAHRLMGPFRIAVDLICLSHFYGVGAAPGPKFFAQGNGTISSPRPKAAPVQHSTCGR